MDEVEVKRVAEHEPAFTREGIADGKSDRGNRDSLTATSKTKVTSYEAEYSREHQLRQRWWLAGNQLIVVDSTQLLQRYQSLFLARNPCRPRTCTLLLRSSPICGSSIALLALPDYAPGFRSH